MNDTTPSVLPMVVMMIVGAAAIFWLLRRFRPGMPMARRTLWVVGGGIVLGGLIYGAVFAR